MTESTSRNDEDHGENTKQSPSRGTSSTNIAMTREERKAAKAAAKAKRQEDKRAKRIERRHRHTNQTSALLPVLSGQNFGDAVLVQSQQVTATKWTKIGTVSPGMAGQIIRVRGFLQSSKRLGKCVFVVIRSSMYTIQGVAVLNASQGPQANEDV